MKTIKILTTVGLLALGLYLAPAVSAATSQNVNTGSGSINRVRTRDIRSERQSSFKLGAAVNVDLVDESTGGNSTSQNTTGTNEVKSGNTVAVVTSDDVVNYGETTITQTSDPDTDLAQNNTTGSGSINTAKVTRVRRASTREVAIGGVLNVSVVDLSTGGNSASQNTSGPSTVDTGNSTATISHMSDVNTSYVDITQ